MKNLKLCLAFSHIYIEEAIRNDPLVKTICQTFPDAKLIYIENYKDIFNRKNQNYCRQKEAVKLILAKKPNNFLYSWSDNCINVADNSFYLTQVINCLYDCEYCFLKGMYDSANLLFFINTEDFDKAISMLKSGSYISLSYETDILSLDKLFTNLIDDYLKIISNNADKKFEIRTKSLNVEKMIDAPENLLITYSILPEILISKFEKYTPSLEKRLLKINWLLAQGIKVRLAIDPILVMENYLDEYRLFCQKLKFFINLDKLEDIHVGPFRIAKDFLKKAKAQYSESLIWNYPYQIKNGNYTYNKVIFEEIINVFKEELPINKLRFLKEIENEKDKR
ncbi:MAG: hypothetical protein FWE36_01730 [Erysipelotrichales bacterium]|nr:hypothetical protein [Erysipelotrichales bacterium]